MSVDTFYDQESIYPLLKYLQQADLSHLLLWRTPEDCQSVSEEMSQSSQYPKSVITVPAKGSNISTSNPSSPVRFLYISMISFLIFLNSCEDTSSGPTSPHMTFSGISPIHPLVSRFCPVSKLALIDLNSLCILLETNSPTQFCVIGKHRTITFGSFIQIIDIYSQQALHAPKHWSPPTGICLNTEKDPIPPFLSVKQFSIFAIILHSNLVLFNSAHQPIMWQYIKGTLNIQIRAKN